MGLRCDRFPLTPALSLGERENRSPALVIRERFDSPPERRKFSRSLRDESGHGGMGEASKPYAAKSEIRELIAEVRNSRERTQRNGWFCSSLRSVRSFAASSSTVSRNSKSRNRAPPAPPAPERAALLLRRRSGLLRVVSNIERALNVIEIKIKSKIRIKKRQLSALNHHRPLQCSLL